MFICLTGFSLAFAAATLPGFHKKNTWQATKHWYTDRQWFSNQVIFLNRVLGKTPGYGSPFRSRIHKRSILSQNVKVVSKNSEILTKNLEMLSTFFLDTNSTFRDANKKCCDTNSTLLDTNLKCGDIRTYRICFFICGIMWGLASWHMPPYAPTLLIRFNTKYWCKIIENRDNVLLFRLIWNLCTINLCFSVINCPLIKSIEANGSSPHVTCCAYLCNVARWKSTHKATTNEETYPVRSTISKLLGKFQVCISKCQVSISKCWLSI